MLQGEARADPSNFYAHAPPPGKDWTYVGPHIMVVLPDAGAKHALRGQNLDVSTGATSTMVDPSPWKLPELLKLLTRM